MKSEISPDITSQIVEKATEFGASLTGIADVEEVKNSPSHLVYGKPVLGYKYGCIEPFVPQDNRCYSLYRVCLIILF